MKKVLVGLLASLLSTAALAGVALPPPVEVPEPGVMGLFAAGAVAIFIAKKFKK